MSYLPFCCAQTHIQLLLSLFLSLYTYIFRVILTDSFIGILSSFLFVLICASRSVFSGLYASSSTPTPDPGYYTTCMPCFYCCCGRPSTPCSNTYTIERQSATHEDVMLQTRKLAVATNCKLQISSLVNSTRAIRSFAK